MNTVRFGTDSEHIDIRLPATYSTEGWAQAEVQVAVSSFYGSISPWIERNDLEVFSVQLRRIYETLKGEAEFKPLEDQFVLKLSAGSTGKIQLTGHAWSMACHGNQLRFEFELDQSFLLAPLEALENIHGKMMPNPSFHRTASGGR